LYFAELNLPSYINGPGLSEAVLVADRNRIDNVVFSGAIDLIYMDNEYLENRVHEIFQNYIRIGSSQYGLTLFKRRN
jgi:hypothetical protein